MEPFLWRRHLKSCTEKSKGRACRECKCPIWLEAYIDGKRVRRSLDMTDWDRAERRLARLMDPEAPQAAIPVTEAIEEYIGDCRARHLKDTTVTSYEKTLGYLAEFCQRSGYQHVHQLSLEALTRFRSSRTAAVSRRKNAPAELKPIEPSTSRKELETLRAFCAFAVERRWLPVNLAKRLKPPKEHGVPTLPFEPSEITDILKACDEIDDDNGPNAQRARLRAKALVLLLLYAGLRISDAAKLERRKLDMESGKLLIRTMKTGAPLYIRLHSSALEALAALPHESRYFFWSGRSKLSSIIGNLRRTVQIVVRKAGINGHPHRFRDTFAVRLLEQDVPIRTVSLLLGHTSVKTTEKHYAPYLASQQRLLDEAVAKLDFGESSRPPAVHRKPPRHALNNRKRNSKHVAGVLSL